MRLIFALIVLLVGCGCAPIGSPADRQSPTPPADEIERAAAEFRATLFRELSERAAKSAETDPGSWEDAQKRWESDQAEARKIAATALNAAIKAAKGEREAWDVATYREIQRSLARGWDDE